MSLDHTQTIEFASDEPRHFDMMPSILDYLTYIEEEVDEKTGERRFFRKRLKPVDKELYRVLRFRAGKGACWRDTKDLAAHVNAAPDTISKSKKVLSMPFEQLEGQSLISVNEKRIPTRKNGKNINKRPVHCITITNIWRYNNSFMDKVRDMEKERSFQEALWTQMEIPEEEWEPRNVPSFAPPKVEISHKEAEIAMERMMQDGLVAIVHNLGVEPKNRTSKEVEPKNRTSSPGGSSQNWDVNKYNSYKHHCIKTNTKAKALAIALLTSSVVEEELSSYQGTLQWLQKFGYKRKIAKDLLEEFTIQQIQLTAWYVQEQLTKEGAKEKQNILGYFLSVLKNRYYEPKCE